MKDGEALEGLWDLYHLDDMLASQYQSIDWTQHTTCKRTGSDTVTGKLLALLSSLILYVFFRFISLLILQSAKAVCPRKLKEVT